jgi:hypothetical protein
LTGFSFSFPDGNPSHGILTAQFAVAGIDRADDSGTLNLTLSATTGTADVRGRAFYAWSSWVFRA